MPILIPPDLPATTALRRDAIRLIGPQATGSPGLLRVALVNLMPDKISTERQFARQLGATEHEVALTLVRPGSYRPRTTSTAHLERFYATWRDVEATRFDAVIITGAPVEMRDFEDVDYWPELVDILDWARTCVPRSLHVCWAAQAALYRHHNVPKHILPRKAFGLFHHRACVPGASLLRGLGRDFIVPVSRHTETRVADLPEGRGIEVLAVSGESGLCLVQEDGGRLVYMMNHLEYEADTLWKEYLRDRENGLGTPPPAGHPDGPIPADAQLPWHAAARVFFGRWLDGVAAGRTSDPALISQGFRKAAAR